MKRVEGDISTLLANDPGFVLRGVTGVFKMANGHTAGVGEFTNPCRRL